MSSDSAVSVVMPAYQVSAYIAQALDSVLRQTRPAAEIIVVNDGCPDTPGLERALAPYLERIRYLKRPNGGPGAARNIGVHAAGSELVAFLDADDYWAPEFLERQAGYLDTHPDIDLVYTNALYVLDDGTVVTTLMDGAPSRGEPTLYALLEGDCTVATSTVVARRSRLLAAGLFDESIGNYSEDFDLWLRVAHSGGRIAYQREALVHHRIHPASLTARPLQLPRGALQVLRKTRAHLDLTDEQRAALDRRAARIEADILAQEAKDLLAAGQYGEAHARLVRSTQLVPSRKRSVAALSLRLAPRLARLFLTRRRQHARPSAQ